MAMLAEDYDFVIGGDPDRDTIDLAVLDTGTGRVLAHVAEAADGAGYERMLTWADEHAPGRRIWALEGTGSFAASLAAVLIDADETVAEVGALKRSHGAKKTIVSTLSAPHARHWLEMSRARREPAAYAKRYEWYSLVGKVFWSAGPRPSTSSRA
ncbi:hypothetical protein ACFOJ6_04525 [Gordonia humi]|uniref:hypothetical protein n=1 Tax=Gordonia humi TaxID=686429 RepID=UPI00360B2C1E